MIIEREIPPTTSEVENFLEAINFQLPQGLIEFYKDANGAYVRGNNQYLAIWPITELIQSNREYNVDEYAPDFFIFGSSGGGLAYAIEKETGNIFEMPFIGMSREEAVFKSNNFYDFLKLYE